MIFNAKDNKPHLDALRYPALMLCQYSVDRAGRQWNGNTITLKGALVRLVDNWDQVAHGIPCPVHFDADDRGDPLHIEGQWFAATTLVEHWRSVLNDLGQDGWVGNESYETSCGDVSMVEEAMAG